MAIKISASRLKTLEKCTMSFYYQEILKLPSVQHHKTAQGSCIHRLFQLIMAPKRLNLFKHIMEYGFDMTPPIERYIRFYDFKHHISPYDIKDMESMLKVAFLGISHTFSDNSGLFRLPQQYENERRFELKIGAATISGFIDLLVVSDNKTYVFDLKTQGAKFTKSELQNNYQGLIYQMAVEQELHVVPTVDFIMLRHSPTARTPDKHIQRVNPHSPPIRIGFRSYLNRIYSVVNNFTLEEAYSSPCKDIFFCERVCPYYRPFDYYSVINKSDNSTRSTYLSLDAANKSCQNDEMVVKSRHGGCELRFSQ